MQFDLGNEDKRDLTKVLSLAQYLMLPELEEMVLDILALSDPNALKR